MYDKFADDVFVKSKIFAPSIQNAEVNSRKLKNCDIRNDDLIFNAMSLRQAKVSWGVSTEVLILKVRKLNYGLSYIPDSRSNRS